MSRLVESQVVDIINNMKELNASLNEICGAGLHKIALVAAGLKPDGSSIVMPGHPVAVVPVTAGLGIIPEFCLAVKNIIEFLDVPAFITEHTDVRGLAEVAKRKSEVFIIADDNTFSAVNIPKCLYSDNSEATGRGFAAALELAACKRDGGNEDAGFDGKEVLIIGAGPVGVSAAQYVQNRHGRVTVYDIDASRASYAKDCVPDIAVSDDLYKSLKNINLVVDATPSNGFITYNMLRDDTIISSPGVPEGYDAGCEKKMQGRIIYDCLAIGVATMIMEVLKA